jgi:hypothetical protein
MSSAEMTRKQGVAITNRSVVRGSCPPHSYGRRVSLVLGWDCTTLKGRTTVGLGIQAVRLPRFARNDNKSEVLAMTKNGSV